MAKRRTPAKPVVRFQLARYQTNSNDSWHLGIAALNFGFGTADIRYILNPDTGKLVRELHAYELLSGHFGHCLDLTMYGKAE